MMRITTRRQLVALRDELGVNHEWHEPDNSGVSAEVHGGHLDNTGAWPTFGPNGEERGSVEFYVELWREVDDVMRVVAAVNLADLLAWATRYETKSEYLAGDLDATLRQAGIDYPLGLRGVRDLVVQRDGYLDALREKDAEIAELRAKLKSSARAASLARHPSRTASPAVSQGLVDGDIIREFDDKHIAHLIRRYGDGRAVAALAKPGDEAQFDEANREADALHAEVLAQFKTRLTEAEYRTKIAGEIRDRADEIALTGENRSLGHVLALLIRDVADRVGMMS